MWSVYDNRSVATFHGIDGHTMHGIYRASMSRANHEWFTDEEN